MSPYRARRKVGQAFEPDVSWKSVWKAGSTSDRKAKRWTRPRFPSCRLIPGRQATATRMGTSSGLFYVPALSCAAQYDRTTGYFSADALVLAARGIERLIANGGKMRLIVGCTLDVDEIEAIERGYDLREQVAKKLASIDLTPPTPRSIRPEALAWMVANQMSRHQGRGAHQRTRASRSCSAASTTRRWESSPTARVIASPSAAASTRRGRGWISNRESFHVHLSWEGGRDFKHVQDEVEAFEKLWEGRAWSVQVLDFPEAAKTQLLEFLPTDDRFVTPPRRTEGQRSEARTTGGNASPSAAARRSPSRGLDLHPERSPGLERFPGG